MKMKAWKRVLSLVLAVLVVAPMILGALPQLTLEADAAVDAGAQGAGLEGQLINGVYEIYYPGTDLALGLRGEGSDRPLYLENATHSNLQRWVIEYGGSMDVDGDASNGAESHWYTIRNLQNGYLLGQTWNYFVKTVGGDTTNPYCQWRIEYDAATGTYSFQCWGQYYADGTGTPWPGYMTPVVKLQSDVTAYEHLAVTDPADGVLIGGKADPVGFQLYRVPIQYYDDYELEAGTYRVMDPSHTYYWDADPDTLSDPGLNNSGSSALACAGTKQTDGTQLFQIDWTSKGFVTIFDCYSGRYLGDRNGNSTMLDGAIGELWDDPSNWFDDRLRFYWVVVPAYSDTTRQADHFYLCNVLTGNSLTMTTSTVQNYRVGGTAWYFTKLTDYQIGSEGMSQGYNGNTGVYMDSFDHSDTIKLPITIYDYVNDGMLFEYAQSNAGGTNSSDNSDTLYDAAGRKFQAGNNLAFSLLTGSYGGEWNGRGGAYYAYLDDGTSVAGNDPGAWNTYETFSVGRMWFKYSASNGWYASGTSTTSNSYYWEKHGLGNFRANLADRATTSDAASVYMIYGLNRDIPQGLNKTTLHGDGSSGATMFTDDLKSGDTSVDPSGSSYTLSWSGYSYDLYGYLAGTATIGMVQPELNQVTGAPEYRDVVVEYLADLLKKALAVPETNPSNSAEYAYNYVNGADHDRYGTVDGAAYRGLDDWLRSRMTGEGHVLGTYAETKAKADKLIGTWADCSYYIRTYCDAAYYLLNNLFVPYSYNEPQDMFDYLELTSVKMDDSDGNIVDAYVFDSGFTTKGTGVNSQSAVYYDTQNKVIKNTAVTGKANAFLNVNTASKTTNYACAHPFLPVWETLDMDTQTGTQATTLSPYFNDDGVSETSAEATATYQNRNYNFVLASNGEFQYSYDEELFFNFEGDDDVYLFINGQLVMDLGAAHGIAGFSLNLNDYVDAARAAVANNTADDRDRALALEEGGIYSFDFYYMERHGWGSNMRIATNIRVVEKGMLVDKGGAQLGVELESNDMIDPDEAVEYKFTLTNSGTEDLIWPTFTDNDIQVKISYDQGLQILEGAVNGQTVMDANGGELDVTDLIVTYYNPKTGNTTTRTFASNEALIAYLTNELVIETQAESTPPFGELTIRGIYYKLTDAQKEAGVFRNTVTVTAQVRNSATSLKQVNVPVSGGQSWTDAIAPDSTGALTDGKVTVSNTSQTDQTWPYINYIGQVTINPEGGLTVPSGSTAVDRSGGELEVEDLTFIYTAPDGSVTVSTFTDNAQLIEYLKNGVVIAPGGTLEVEGVWFQTTENVDLAINTLVRDESSQSSSNDPSNITLEDQADFTVYVPNIPKYYHWMDHELVIYHSILSEDIKTMAANADNPLSQIFLPVVQSIDSLVLVDADGDPITSDEVWIEGNDIHADFQTTGIKLIHLNVGYSYLANGLTRTATATVPVQIYVYNVEDRTYVLDYGLKTQLSYDEIFGGDVLVLTDHETQSTIMGIDSEPSSPYYGSNSVLDFTMLVDGSGAPAWGIVEDGANAYYHGSINIWNENTGSDIFLSYTPKELMENRDHVYIALRVWEDGYADGGTLGATDIRNEVMMFKDITFLPANVVYYEDNFPALNVTGDFEDPTLLQSWDQTVQYGYDKVYASDADVTTSGGHIAAVPIVPPTAEQIASGEVQVQAAKFSFSGTGFELISRTDATSAAAIQFDIYRLVEQDGQWVREDLDGDGDTEDDIFKRIPVITEYDNHTTSGPGAASSTLDQGTGGAETIYQVPVFRLSGLDYGRYEVVISGIPVVSDIQVGEDGSTTPVYTETTYLYIDGIRIYDPLADATEAEYGEEYGAEFTELRTLVFDNQAAVLGLTSDPSGAPGLTGTYGAHNSFAESRNDGWFQSNTGDLQQFAIAGPNNEVYIDGTSNTYAVLFYVAEDVAGQGLLHVGVHDLYDDMFYGMDSGENLSSSLRYWLADGMWSTEIPIGKSGTEQYYVIDYRSCPTVAQDGKTYYQVAIQVAEGMVSFTNVKTVGLSFADLTPETSFVKYRFDGNFLYEAPRYDMDGNEIPEAQLDWQPVSLVQRYHYRINSETGDLERADRYDAEGNEIATEDLKWSIINSAVTSSVYHMRDVLTTTRTADDEIRVEDTQIQMPQIPEEQTGWPAFPGDDGRSLWDRIVAWLDAIAKMENKERSAEA